ncbi:MAG TPA: outer membrane lipoprotein carrier protein LolA [Blastocatellia bacterium]|nr:outer membrane lipoprotein carrier protein LolA [Blastocatellia bacterium]
MNRTKLLFIAVTLIAFAVLQPLRSSANGDLDQILAKMESAARSIKTAEANLDQEKRDMQIGGREVYRGRIFLSHAKNCDRVRINYSLPEGQVVLVECEKITLYQPGIKQAIVTTRKAQASRNQEFSFIATPYKSVPELKSQYNIAHIGDESVGGAPTAKLELTPKAQSSIRKLTLWVDQSSWVPIKYQVVETSGNITTFTLTGMRVNGGLGGDVFKLSLPKGTKVVPK